MSRTRPEVYYGGIALGFVLGIVVLLFLVFRLPWTWYHFLAGWLVAINLVTFFYYGFAIYGTNDISQLGGPVSHGCVRMHPSHAAALCVGRARRRSQYADRDLELAPRDALC